MSALIDMFTRNIHCTIHVRYNKIKHYKLSWDQFLTKLKLIDDKESMRFISQHKDKFEGKHCPSQDSLRTASKQKSRGLLTCAEDIKMI